MSTFLLFLQLTALLTAYYQVLSPTHTSIFTGVSAVVTSGSSDLLSMSGVTGDYTLLTWVKFKVIPGTWLVVMSIVNTGVVIVEVGKMTNGNWKANARDSAGGIVTCQVAASVSTVWTHVAVIVVSTPTPSLTLVVTEWLSSPTSASIPSPNPFTNYDPTVSVIYAGGPVTGGALTVTRYTGLYAGYEV